MRELGFGVSLMFLVGGLTLAGCESGGGSGDDDGDGTTVDGGNGGSDGGGNGVDAGAGDWITLAEGSWTIPPPSGSNPDEYHCIYKTVTEEMYVTAFKPISPLGTHHTVVTMYEGSQADGIYPCGVGTNGNRMIYGSGVGSPEFHFPEGIAIKLNPGDKILVNLHLFNVGDGPLSGTSGTLVKTIPASQVQHEAELVLMGPTVSLNVPTGTSTQSGHCNIQDDINIFAVAPHMHQTGTHLRSVARRSGVDIELMDEDYDFDNQVFYYVMPFVDLHPGDRVTTHCTYNNPTDKTKTFGESSNDEMCFSSVFYYPKKNRNFICSQVF